jgi:hypothetical protein
MQQSTAIPIQLAFVLIGRTCVEFHNAVTKIQEGDYLLLTPDGAAAVFSLRKDGGAPIDEVAVPSPAPITTATATTAAAFILHTKIALRRKERSVRMNGAATT